ncbi:MAG: porin, partial [Oleiphilaceae bacterium]|nr:porin [Oleiphilaceae bacterium]
MQSTKLKNFNIAKGLAMGTGGLLLAAAQPALAQQNPTIENLQTQIQEMQVQMDELERDVIVPDAPGSFMLPGTDTSMKIGGYVKADAIYDFDQDMGDSLFVQGLETGDVAEDSSFRAHARQSRLNVSTSTPT